MTGIRSVSRRALACIALASCLTVPGSAAASSCVHCHGNPDLYVKERNLYEYYQDWLQSPHAVADLSCENCHGGDPNAQTVATAHPDELPLTDPQSPLYYKNQPQTCGTCHVDKVEQFRESKHYKALVADTLAPTCTTCHRAMNRRPYYRDILVYACKTCHNEENAARLPLVADRAEEILHRLNVAKGYLGWTSVYYESLGWPGDSKQKVSAISSQYDEAVTRVHSFDLEQMDESSTRILTDLKLMFQQAWDERRQKDES